MKLQNINSKEYMEKKDLITMQKARVCIEKYAVNRFLSGYKGYFLYGVYHEEIDHDDVIIYGKESHDKVYICIEYQHILKEIYVKPNTFDYALYDELDNTFSSLID